MLLSVLLVPLVVLAVVVAIQRFALPAFFALMAAALAYGVLADRHIHAYGRAFSLGFTTALEQVGLLTAVGALMILVARAGALPTSWVAGAGLAAGSLTSAAGGLGLLQPAGEGAPRRALLLVLTTLAAQALLLPSPVAVAAAWVVRADLGRMLATGLVVAAIAAGVAWVLLRQRLPADKAAEAPGRAWAIVAVVMVLMLIHALAQVPSEPLGTRAANLFYTNLGRPFVASVVGLALLAVWFRARFSSVAAEARFAPLVLTVAAAGGLSFVLNETGAPELLAETFADPRLGLLVPFLTAASVKTMQGGSLTAVLTAVGMTEPLLAPLGFDSGGGRVLVAAAAGAGSIAICHVNDPLFWIAAHLLGVSPARALVLVGGGSALVSLTALAILAGASLFVG